MKNFLEGLKDLLYDSVDYIIMISIILGVVFVIGWRLDVLFANDALDFPNKGEIIVQKPVDTPKPAPPDNNTDDPITDIVDGQDPTNPENKAPDKEPTSNPEKDSVKINIPSGSLTSNIGDILAFHGLVSSKTDFIEKAQELKLDKKLKSGNFVIEKNLSIEEVLKIITK